MSEIATGVTVLSIRAAALPIVRSRFGQQLRAVMPNRAGALGTVAFGSIAQLAR